MQWRQFRFICHVICLAANWLLSTWSRNEEIPLYSSSPIKWSKVLLWNCDSKNSLPLNEVAFTICYSVLEAWPVSCTVNLQWGQQWNANIIFYFSLMLTCQFSKSVKLSINMRDRLYVLEIVCPHLVQVSFSPKNIDILFSHESFAVRVELNHFLQVLPDIWEALQRLLKVLTG